MVSNIQSWLGYESNEDAPSGNLGARRLGPQRSDLHNGTEVRDECGKIMAIFRNSTDAPRYIADMNARIAAGRAAYEVLCASQPPERDDDKTACPKCGKFFGSVRQHRKQSTKCKATGVAP